MLVLSRQRDETIMIGDDIEITVVDIRGDKVRLGISAPTRVAVHRKEVYEAIRSENEQAARAAGSSELPDLRRFGAAKAGDGAARAARPNLPGLSVRATGPGNGLGGVRPFVEGQSQTPIPPAAKRKPA